MFWADQEIKNIEKSRPKEKYIISDYKTPSGRIHVGALRGVLIHDVVRVGLESDGKKVLYQYGFDDHDPMDSLPIYLPKSFKKYLGMPLYKVPSPEPSAKNFAEFYAKEFREVFEKMGVNARILWISEEYKAGKFNDAILTLLKNSEKIRKIYKEVSGSNKPQDWYPFQVICPKCGKLGTTRVFGFDGKEVEFECEEDLVEWAKGCSYHGKISPYNGNGKLPWKVEWAAKWKVYRTDVEGAGKDHWVKGGSHDIAQAIFEQILRGKTPYCIKYEHLLFSGKKMSSSKGIGVSAVDISKILPLELIRFLIIKTPARRQIEFTPEGETIPRLYDEYDKAANIYKENKFDPFARAFWYSQIGMSKKPEFSFRFHKAAYLAQMPNVNILKKAEKEKGSKLTENEKRELKDRVAEVERWLSSYAPEHYKFEIRKKLPDEAGKLSDAQKEFLKKVGEKFTQKKWEGAEFHSEIHKIRKEMAIDPKEAFSAIYIIFAGKPSGPQAGWMLVALDRDFVIKRFGEIT